MSLRAITRGLQTVRRRLVTELTPEEARQFFLRSDSYFSDDLPRYIGFEQLLKQVDASREGKSSRELVKRKPQNPGSFERVNFPFITNKDGRMSWRQYELIHPLLYVLLVDVLCQPENWALVQARFADFSKGLIQCASVPTKSDGPESEKATKIASWWHGVEQEALAWSLKFNTLIHADVQDCYGSIYTHSIPWALHTREKCKALLREVNRRGQEKLWGDDIDLLIREGRSSQTNGIAQGSVLMDFVAEIVLGYGDELITASLSRSSRLKGKPFHIIRYRDDYKIFSETREDGEAILRIVADELRGLGMRLNTSKTAVHDNVVSGAIKRDKLASLELSDALSDSRQSFQKQLLRVHSFAQQFPNSGALRRMCAELHQRASSAKRSDNSAEVEAAIAVAIVMSSPSAFPPIAGILSHILFPLNEKRRKQIWIQIRERIRSIPHSGYLDLWLQRVFISLDIEREFVSSERLCQVVEGNSPDLWESAWIPDRNVANAIDVNSILLFEPKDLSPRIDPKEIALFNRSTHPSAY